MSHTLMAQEKGHVVREANKQLKISLTDIIGNWYSVDSSTSLIRFINHNNSIVEIDGLYDGAGNYSFIVEKDSILVNGTAPNWPPYNCTLRLLKRNHLEIEFYQFFSKESTKIEYRR